MVTTSGGALTLIGLKSGNTFTFSIYVSDVVGEYWKFATDAAAGATSQAFVMVPNEPCRIIDISLLATPTVSTTSGIYTNDVQTGQSVNVGNVLYTVQNRSFPRIVLAGGKKLTIKQF